MTDHKQPDQQGAEGDQPQALVTRITTIKNKKHEDGKSPRADLDADIAELLEITGKIDSNSSEWQDANNEMNRLKKLKSKEEALAERKAAYNKAVAEWNNVLNKRTYTRGGTKEGSFTASNGVTLKINKNGTPAPFKG